MPTVEPEHWSYVRANIGAEGRDKARYELGDTGVIRDKEGNVVWLLYDEEIDALIGTGTDGDPTRYALGVAEAAEGLAVRFAQSAEVYTGPTGDRVEWKSRVSQWNAVAARMRARLVPAPVEEQSPGATVVAAMEDPSGLTGYAPMPASGFRYR